MARGRCGGAAGSRWRSGLARGRGRPAAGWQQSSTGYVGRPSRRWEWERTWLPAEWDCPPHHHRLSDSEAAQRAASAALCSLSSAPPGIICSRSIGRSAPRTRTSHLAPRASYPIRSAPPTASPPTPTTSYNFYNLLLPCHDPICCTCTTRTTSHHEPRTMHLPPRTSSCPSPPPATPGTCSFLSEQVVVKTTDLLHLHNSICCTQPARRAGTACRHQRNTQVP